MVHGLGASGVNSIKLSIIWSSRSRRLRNGTWLNWQSRFNRFFRAKRWLAVLVMVASSELAIGDGKAGRPDESVPAADLIDPLPLEPAAPPDPIRGQARRDGNAIDRFIEASWAEYGVKPARQADDYTFARRVYLDIAGVIPTYEQMERYLNHGRNRRTKLIDRLLQSNRYADHWAVFWGDLFREKANVEGAERFAFRDYIRTSLADNKPYDVWVREMLSATGRADEVPAATFLLAHGSKPEELTLTTTQVFLGVQLRCAECHDHPFEAWKQTDYLGMREFFRGTVQRRVAHDDDASGGDGNGPYGMEVRQNRKESRGRFVTGASSALGSGREGLAELLTRKDNPYFARVAVNRIWAVMFGVGLVNPPDGFSLWNPPSHPMLLDWLALEFIENGYDLQHVIRLICNSRTYQLASHGAGAPLSSSPPTIELFAQMPLKRMTAEQLHDSVLVACGLVQSDGAWRPAIEKPFPAGPGSFLNTFGSHARETIQERDTAVTIPQALTLLNGNFLNRAVQMHPTHPVRRWLEAAVPRREVVRRLFISTLSRPPTDDERDDVLDVAQTESTWADVQWALINTREFMFVH